MKTCGRIIEKINRTHHSISIRTEKMDISFDAGQFFKVYSNDEFRCLSASCSPRRNYVEFTKKITESRFSSWLQSLKIGDKITIEGPYGRFVMVEDEKILFIAGGIGITPIFSMIEDAFLTSSKKDFVLFYGNKSSEDIVFYNELNSFSQSLKLKLFIFTEDANQQFYHGVITAERISALLPDPVERTAFVCGPTHMVESMSEQIKKYNISRNIKTEKLIGY